MPVRHRITVRVASAVAIMTVLALMVSTNASAAAPRAHRHTVAGMASAASSPALWTVSQWEQRLQQRWSTDNAKVYLPLSEHGDSWDYYNLAFGIDAATAMWRATGKTSYLDQSLQLINNVVASARPVASLRSQFHDNFLGWTSQRSDVKGQEVPLFESFMWRYVTDLLTNMKASPAVYGNSTYRAQYDKLLAFTETNIWQKWYSRSVNAYMFRVNTHMASHWAFIGAELAKLTSNATIATQAQQVADAITFTGMRPYNGASLRGNLHLGTKAAGAYFWSADWNGTADDEDVPHASGVVSFAVAAHDLGYYWTSADMAAFTKTVTQVIWKSNGTFSFDVGGSGSGNGIIEDGFEKLGRYDAAFQLALQTRTGATPDNYGAVSDFYAQGALNAALLGVR